MKKLALSLVPIALIVACSNEPEPQDPSAVQPGYGQPYGQQPYGQQGYGQPAGGYTQPAPSTTATTPAPAAGGFAIPCGQQAQSSPLGPGCGTHKCNESTNTCIIPCASNNDCVEGSACTMGVCIPGAAPSGGTQ